MAVHSSATDGQQEISSAAAFLPKWKPVLDKVQKYIEKLVPKEEKKEALQEIFTPLLTLSCGLPHLTITLFGVEKQANKKKGEEKKKLENPLLSLSLTAISVSVEGREEKSISVSINTFEVLNQTCMNHTRPVMTSRMEQDAVKTKFLCLKMDQKKTKTPGIGKISNTFLTPYLVGNNISVALSPLHVLLERVGILNLIAGVSGIVSTVGEVFEAKKVNLAVSAPTEVNNQATAPLTLSFIGRGIFVALQNSEETALVSAGISDIFYEMKLASAKSVFMEGSVGSIEVTYGRTGMWNEILKFDRESESKPVISFSFNIHGIEKATPAYPGHDMELSMSSQLL